jgi:hypothetical protein
MRVTAKIREPSFVFSSLSAIECSGGELVYCDCLAHLFFVHAKAHRGAGLPMPTTETMFEVTAKGRVHTVPGAKLKDWILKERTQRKGPQGYMFGKRPTME